MFILNLNTKYSCLKTQRYVLNHNWKMFQILNVFIFNETLKRMDPLAVGIVIVGIQKTKFQRKRYLWVYNDIININHNLKVIMNNWKYL